MPKKVDGLGARDTDPGRATDEGLEGAFDPAGLNETAAALGRNSEALTFRLKRAAEFVDVGVCRLECEGLPVAWSAIGPVGGRRTSGRGIGAGSC